MIAMQVTDKNPLYLVVRDLKARHLHLSAFTTINEKEPIGYLKKLAGWKPAICRDCPT
jgi:hypothetical protein